MNCKELYLLLEQFLLENDFYSQYVNYVLERNRMTLEEWVEWFISSPTRRKHLVALMSFCIVPINIKINW